VTEVTAIHELASPVVVEMRIECEDRIGARTPKTYATVIGMPVLVGTKKPTTGSS
jgi:hypothetical protein